MSRKFIALVTGTAIAVATVSAGTAQANGTRYSHQTQPFGVQTLSPQQNRAQQNTHALMSAIAGLTALYIVGKTIEENSKSKKKHVHTQPNSNPPKAKKPKASQGHGHSDHAHSNSRKGHWHGPRGHRHVQGHVRGHGGHAHWHRHPGGIRHIHRHAPRHHGRHSHGFR